MKKTLNSFQLKVIALIFMIIDHLHTYLFYQAWPRWVSLFPRFVSPLFLYLMVDGYHHTRNRKKYAFRLLGAAGVMLLGNMAINITFHNVDLFTGRFTLYSIIQGNNVFLTLGLLFVVVWMIDTFWQSDRKWKNALLGMVCALLSIFSEGGIYLLPLAVIFTLCYGKTGKQCLYMAAFCLLLLMKALYNYWSGNSGCDFMTTMCFNAEWAMIFTIPFLYAYNGERGPNTAASKWMFYIIYPVHLWLLMILRFMN